MDIDKIRVLNEDDGIDVVLPTYDEKQPKATVRVAGTFSKRYREARKRFGDAVTAAHRRHEPMDDTALDDAQFELEAACIISWDFTASGKPLPITGKQWQAVAEMRPDWRERLALAMQDHERFFVAS